MASDRGSPPEPEVALITGSRKGIGRALAEHFLERGAVVEGCSRDDAGWEAENYRHHKVDVRDEGQVRGMIRDIATRHGRLDIVINNAGVASMNHVLLTPSATATKILDINVAGTFTVCREAARLMQRHRYGRVINMGSVAGPLKLEGEAIYAASKSALLTFSQIFAREVAPYGITCNVIAPTPVATDLIKAVPPEKLDKLIQRLTLKRLATFRDITNVVDFFASPASDYITGQVLYLGGV